MLLAIDSGNWNVKVAWENGCDLFDSCLGKDVNVILKVNTKMK